MPIWSWCHTHTILSCWSLCVKKKTLWKWQRLNITSYKSSSMSMDQICCTETQISKAWTHLLFKCTYRLTYQHSLISALEPVNLDATRTFVCVCACVCAWASMCVCLAHLHSCFYSCVVQSFALFPPLLPAVGFCSWLSNRLKFQVAALLTPEEGPWGGLVLNNFSCCKSLCYQQNLPKASNVVELILQ